MIDQNLIELSSKHAEVKLLQGTPTSCPYLWTLEDFLPKELIVKLLDFVKQENLPWTKVIEQQYLNRQSISWLSDTVVEETRQIFDNLTSTVEKLIDSKQTFEGISIWHDQHPYQIPRHIDRSPISAAIQIYLSVGEVDTTTCFEWKNHIIKPKNAVNSGYFMNNKGKVVHYLANPVPEGFSRYSVYAIWKNQ